ncbi:MAG: rhomboid family intramembrane serine protease, partial [Firmicutes bacterium]|nr:rhomboid family intramembrane serine protease [Bacillota bacterium]
FCGGKQVGPNLYCIIAVDANAPDYKQKFEQTAGYIGGSYSMQNFNLVILGVFAADEITDELKEYASVEAETFEKVNILKWCLTPQGVEVFGNQPNRLLNIKQLLESSLESKAEGSLKDIVAENHQKKQNSIVSRDTVLTYIIFAVVTVVFVCQLGLNGAMLDKFECLPLGKGEFYRYLTSMFLHIGFWHYMSNMLGLYIFGTRVERYYGKAWFLAIYFIGGMMAGFVSSIFLKTAAVGASGAIYALMGAVAAYCIRTKRSANGFDLYFIIIFALVGLAFGGLYAEIDNTAHIAGLLFGLAIGMLKK